MAETARENGVDGVAAGAAAGDPAAPEVSAGAPESSGGAVTGSGAGDPPGQDQGAARLAAERDGGGDAPAPVVPGWTEGRTAEPTDGPTVALPSDDETVPLPSGAEAAPAGSGERPRRTLPRLTAANAMIAVLLALLGFTLVVQLKSNSTDAGLETTRQEDLVRILSDLDAQRERVQEDITALEESQRQLNSGAEGRQAALDEATRRADELGVLAGTLPARGPGLTVSFMAVRKPIAASRVLDAVQELRGAGAEAMQIAGGDGATVRITASTYFLDASGGISVSGRRLTGPYMIMVIGDPKTMETALNIPGGVVASVSGDGGNVAIQEREVVDVTALSPPKELQHARPVS